MKWNPSTFFFIMTIFFSILLTTSSNNYFMNWISLELSLLGFIPLFGGKIVFMSDALTKYFCVQMLGSSLYLFSSIIATSIFMEIFLPMSLLLKLGLFPFIAWMPSVMMMMSWMECAILNTLQKMNPLFILMNSNFSNMNILMILLSGALSVFISAILGFNQTDLRMLMAFSSISHTGWMVSIMKFSMVTLLFYMALYYSLTIAMFINLQKNSMKKISSIYTNSKMTALMLITLAGMPPFPMFFMKMIILIKVVLFSPIISMMLIVGAALSSYYYFFLVLPLLITSSNYQ